MDFIDPVKRRRHSIRLNIGYILIACAVAMATLTLLYQSYGYSFSKDGELIQKGLVFMSSNPKPATIYLNGVRSEHKTRVRLNLPAGQYTVKLERADYRLWQRALGVEGGSVQHFDYPFLFPQKLQTSTVERYDAAPSTVLHSPDRRWLLVQRMGVVGSFDQYDLNDSKQLTKTNVALPANLLTAATNASGLNFVSWSTDNRHVLLQHTYNGGSEYIVFDRQNPNDSLNLTKALNLNPTTQLSFSDNKYDQYFLHDTASGALSKASLNAPTAVPLLEHVRAFKTYGHDMVLYVTAEGASAGKVAVRLLQDGKSYTLRELAAEAKTYLLDLTRYSNNWYIVAGDSIEDKTYVYKNPQSVLASRQAAPLVPAYILKMASPTYLAFSDNAQFIMVQNGANFALYDAENDKGYVYGVNHPFADGQHATWMDGHRLMATVDNKVVVWDYDNANHQTLQAAVSGSIPMFDQGYTWMYAIAPNVTVNVPADGFALSKTALRIPTDQ